MDPKVTFVNGDDLFAFYVDGQLVFQGVGEQVSAEEAIQAVGVSYQVLDMETEGEEPGHPWPFPESLDNLIQWKEK